MRFDVPEAAGGGASTDGWGDGGIGALAFDATGRRLAVGLADRIAVYDPRSGARREEYPSALVPALRVQCRDDGIATMARSVAFTRDGRHLVAGFDLRLTQNDWARWIEVFVRDAGVHAYTLFAPDLARYPDTTSGTGRFALSPDGTRLATSLAERGTTIWDVARGVELRTFADVDAEVQVWSHDGTRLAVVRGGPRPLGVIDTAAGDVRWLALPTRGSGPPACLAFTPDGGRLVVVTAGKSAATSMVDLATGVQRARPLPRGEALSAVHFGGVPPRVTWRRLPPWGGDAPLGLLRQGLTSSLPRVLRLRWTPPATTARPPWPEGWPLAMSLDGKHVARALGATVVVTRVRTRR